MDLPDLDLSTSNIASLVTPAIVAMVIYPVHFISHIRQKYFTGRFYGLTSFLTADISCNPEFFFTCDNGACVPNEFLCDGDFDCGGIDVSDERNCTSRKERGDQEPIS